MEQGSREDMLQDLAAAVESITVAHPTRVAIDGTPAAGKTTLADELAVVLRAQGREVIRATIESFLFPRAQRYRRGEYSADGCYFETHDYDALNRVLVDPLGPDGDRRFQHAVYNRTTDSALSPAEVERRWRERYIPSQKFYFATVHPSDRADIIVINDEPQHPAWESRRR